jgi:hypothetical protein
MAPNIQTNKKTPQNNAKMPLYPQNDARPKVLAPNEKTDNLYIEGSSSATGFFQQSPVLKNQYFDDEGFKRVLGRKYSTFELVEGANLNMHSIPTKECAECNRTRPSSFWR